MVQQFFAGSSGIGDEFGVSIGSVFLIRSRRWRTESIGLPVLCSGGTVATTVTRLGQLPGQLGVLDCAAPTGPILVGDGIFSPYTVYNKEVKYME